MESEFGSQGNPQSDSAFNGRALVEDAPAYDFASLGVSYRPAIGAAQLGANDGVYRVHAVDLAAWHAVEMVENGHRSLLWAKTGPRPVKAGGIRRLGVASLHRLDGRLAVG